MTYWIDARDVEAPTQWWRHKIYSLVQKSRRIFLTSAESWLDWAVSRSIHIG